LAESRSALAEQFDDLGQQYHASTLGMWTFLLTEIMFFGALFTAYTVYRSAYVEGFIAGSHHLDVILGTLMTAILIGSSLTMALAVHAAQVGHSKRLIGFLLLTMCLGLVFLSIKGYEYWHKYHTAMVPGVTFHYQGPYADTVQLFLIFYFVMTAIHALHMIVGLGLQIVLVVLARRGLFSSAYYTPVEIIGLYWHFVDIVWIFLYPLLYLVE